MGLISNSNCDYIGTDILDLRTCLDDILLKLGEIFESTNIDFKDTLLTLSDCVNAPRNLDFFSFFSFYL
jgi:hypothetical protein